jgi:hypothetical protein
MIPYTLHVALLISVCLLFYKVLLQKETFYRLNRVILVFCLALSFILPLISIPHQWALRDSPKPVEVNAPTEINYSDAATIVQNKEAIKQQPVKVATVTKSTTVQAVSFIPVAIKWAFYLYWIGVAAFGLNLLIQLIVLLYRAYTKPVVKDGKFRIIELDGDKAPCSFGNNIFINPGKYDWETYNQILLHEKVHIEQRHSLDIFIAELVLVLQWFNPFAWLYRTEVENNLEFLTDDAVLGHKEVERSSYQMSLLKVSAPHLSLGITTNYNQSLLKKRIVMMNAKKSNLNTMWKYFFLVPLMGILVCALNNPAAYSQAVKTTTVSSSEHGWADRTEGSWFATIKGDKIRIEFKNDDDDHNWSSSSDFKLSDFPSLPKDQKADFTLKREAGSVLFNGKFDGDQGYGHYKFTANQEFTDYIKKQGITNVEDRDAFSFFMIDIKKSYVEMLNKNGYKDLSKNNLISMAALKVDEPFIKMWKQNGYPDITPNQLVSGKALHIDEAYVAEIHKVGYTDLSFNQLISFKSQHITGEYINSLRKAKLKDGKSTGETELPPANQISSYKAMHIDSAYINSFKKAGMQDIQYNQLASMKSQDVTPEFIKGFEDAGYKNLQTHDFISLKAMHVTPEFAKSYEAVGYPNIPIHTLESFKSMNIDPAFIKSFADAGYKNIPANEFISLKSQHITPDFAKGFEALGYKDVPVRALITMKAMGLDPDFIKSYNDAGYKNICKRFISLKIPKDNTRLYQEL